MSRIGDSMRESARTLAQRAAAQAAPRVEAAAAQRAPVRTGALRASIQARADGSGVVLAALGYAKFTGVFDGGFGPEVEEALRAL